MFQQTTTSLRSIFDQVIQKRTTLHESLHHLDILYGYVKPKEAKVDSLLSYPLPKDNKEPRKEGMSLSVRYVKRKNVQKGMPLTLILPEISHSIIPDPLTGDWS